MTTRALLTPLVLRRTALVFVGVVWLSTGVVPMATRALGCPAEVAAARPAASVATGDWPTSHGVDLELRVLNLRVEFPWLKSLPVSPAHRIVISWMATPPRE